MNIVFKKFFRDKQCVPVPKWRNNALHKSPILAVALYGAWVFPKTQNRQKKMDKLDDLWNEYYGLAPDPNELLERSTNVSMPCFSVANANTRTRAKHSTSAVAPSLPSNSASRAAPSGSVVPRPRQHDHRRAHDSNYSAGSLLQGEGARANLATVRTLNTPALLNWPGSQAEGGSVRPWEGLAAPSDSAAPRRQRGPRRAHDSNPSGSLLQGEGASANLAAIRTLNTPLMLNWQGSQPGEGGCPVRPWEGLE